MVLVFRIAKLTTQGMLIKKKIKLSNCLNNKKKTNLPFGL
jgi:hypothetical protein